MDKNVKTQTESQTRGTRGEQITEEDLSIHSNSSGGTIEESRQPKHLSERVSRTDRAGQNPFGSVSQQLIQRLIWQASDRLQEAKDCIEWYENQADKLTKEIKELEELKDSVESQPVSEEE